MFADHTSSEGDGWYKTSMGKFSIPILFFEPGNKKDIKISEKIFQQIDIMPTILEKLNYPKKYFGFGNGLSNDNRFAISILNGVYHFVTRNYFILFDGENIIAVYNWKNDRMLQNNLKETTEYTEDFNLLKAILQTYNKSMKENKLVVNN